MSVKVEVDRAEKWFCWLAILLGIFLRVNGFWKPSLWLDELNTAWVASADGWSMLWQRCLAAHQPPAYYPIVKAFLIFGHNEFFIRLPTVIFGLASIAALMATLQRVAGIRGALYGGAIYALNSRAIFHSQEARMYAMVLFGAIVSTYFFVAALDRGGRWNLAVYAASTLLVAYSHLIYSYALFGQIAVAVCFYFFSKPRPPTLRPLLLTQIVLLLLLAPLATLFLSIVGHSRAGMGGFLPRPGLPYLIWLFEYPEFGAAVVLVLLSLPRLWARRQQLRSLNLRENALLGLGLVYMAIFPAALVLARVNLVNILESRYLLLSVLGAVTVGTFVVVKADDRGLRLALHAYVVVLAVVQLIIACYAGSWLHAQNQDWRGAIQWIQERYRPGDVVLLRSGLIEARYLSLGDPGAFEYLSLPLCGFYDRGGMTVFNLPWSEEQLYSSRLTPAAVQERVRAARQVFSLVAPVVFDNRIRNWDWALLERWIQGHGRPPTQVERRTFESLEVRVYRPAEDAALAH